MSEIGLLVGLYMVDYLITYWGVSRQIIVEANPLMAGLMQLPFYQGFLIRLAVIVLGSIAFWSGRNTKVFPYAMKIGCGVYLLVFVLHIGWIYQYLLK